MTHPPTPKDVHENWSTPTPQKSNEVKAWELLLEIAPEIKHLLPRTVNEPRPPLTPGKHFFLQMVACLKNPIYRAIIQAIVFDMIDDRVKELIVAYITEDTPWEDSPSSTNSKE